MAHDGTINIFVENLGRYNEGHIVGAWIPLPMQRDELWETIRKACKVDALHEEVFIADVEYDFGMPNVKIGEYDSIDDVNALAAAIENADSWDDVYHADCYAYEHNLSTIETASVLRDVDNVAWCSYTTDYGSENSRLGHTLIDEDEYLLARLREIGMEGYIDYEAYGRDARGDYTLCSDGFICDCDPDTSADAEEILRDLDYWTNDEDEDEDE